jgi:hypothetical protein
LGCKRMWQIILFYLDHQWISIFNLYSCVLLLLQTRVPASTSELAGSRSRPPGKSFWCYIL